MQNKPLKLVTIPQIIAFILPTIEALMVAPMLIFTTPEDRASIFYDLTTTLFWLSPFIFISILVAFILYDRHKAAKPGGVIKSHILRNLSMLAVTLFICIPLFIGFLLAFVYFLSPGGDVIH